MRSAWLNLKKDRHFRSFFLSDNEFEKSDLQNTRQQKWQEVQRAVRWFRLIPWISSIWVTGSLAVGNVQKNDDLDFLIITQSHRLWLTRLVVILIGMITQKLRWHDSPKDKVQDRWCCNLWLELSNLSLHDSQNIYTARELVQAWPVYQSSTGEAEKFVMANTWVKHYSLLGWLTAYNRTTTLLSRPPLFSFFSVFPQVTKGLWDTFNVAAYAFQRWYMRPHQKNEKIHVSKAFFHPEDRGAIVEAEYERIVTQLRKTTYGQSPSKNNSALSISH